MTGPPERGRHSRAGAKRELQLAVLLCLLGSALVLLAGSRAWLVLVQDAQPAFAPRRTPITGRALEPGVQALGYVGLAGVVALSATRRAGRTLVGLLLLAGGVAVVAVLTPELGHVPQLLRSRRLTTPGTHVYDHVDTFAWPYVAVAGGLLLALAGLLVSLRGRRWASLSRRYEVPAARDDVADLGPQAAPRGQAAPTSPAGQAAPAGVPAPAEVPPRSGSAARTSRALDRTLAHPVSDHPVSNDPVSNDSVSNDSVSDDQAAPTDGGAPTDRRLWDALDRGEDPTGP